MNVYNSQKESLQYVIEHKTELETASQLALLYIMIISVLCIISHIMTQIVYVKWMKAIQSINDKDNFIRTKSGLLFIIEGFLLLIHPYFFFDNKTFSFIADKTTNEICFLRINYIFLTIFIPIRLWKIAKYFLVCSYYYSLRAQRLCKIMKRDVSIGFVIKSLVFVHPFLIIIVSLCVVALTGGYLFRIWEGVNNNQFKDYINCIYFSIITMTTVGYGNITLKSQMGKGIAVLITICSFVLFGILIHSLNSVFNFIGEEKKAYSIINNMVIKEKMNAVTKEVTVLGCKLYRLRKTMKEITYGGDEEKNNDKREAKLAKLQKEIDGLTKEKERLIKDIHFLNIEMKKSNVDYLYEISQNMDNALKIFNEISTLTNKLSDLVRDSNDTRISLVNIQSHL